MESYVYIDGFNLYYNAVKNTCYKWLDLYKLSVNLFPKNKIIKVKYFTAHVKSIEDSDQLFRQNIYLNALEKFLGDKIELYYGHFTTHWKQYRIARNQEKKPEKDASKQSIRVIKNEEKGSDVNLAVHLLNDACNNLYKKAIIISNDTDLTEALRLISEEYGKKIGLVNPNGKSNCTAPLCKYASFYGILSKRILSESQLPSPIPNTKIYKPIKWN